MLAGHHQGWQESDGGRAGSLAWGLGEVKGTGTGGRGTDRFLEQAAQQIIDIPFGSQRGRNLEEVADRAPHAIKGQGQVVHLPNHRVQAGTRLKLEAPDGGRLLGEVFEILRQDPCKLHQQPNGE